MQQLSFGKLLFFAILFFSFFACKKQQSHHSVLKGFYFWKNEDFYNSTIPKIDSLRPTDRVYIKVLDVDWSPVNGAFPRSYNPMYSDTMRQYVPTVFITNRVFENIKKEDLKDLLKKA
jgi:hypothetical protein